MASSPFHRILVRECVALMLAALLALSGLASARVEAAKVADPAFALCLPGGGMGSDDPADPDHDCSDCCLPAPLALAARLAGDPIQADLARAEPLPRMAGDPARIATGLPWSRGPPQAV
jgi:hypothetical protein